MQTAPPETAVVFFERRRSHKKISFSDRRVLQRRQAAGQAQSPERRRLASQGRLYERESVGLSMTFRANSMECMGTIRNFSKQGLGVTFAVNPPDIEKSRVAVALWNGDFAIQLPGTIAQVTPISSKQGGALVGVRLGTAENVLDAPALATVYDFLRAAKSGDPVQAAITQGAVIRALQDLPSAGQNAGKTVIKRGRKFTPDPGWILEMDRYLEPYRQAIFQSALVQETSTGALSLGQVRGWNIQFYPFIESFPQFIALNLAKAPDPQSRSFMIDNVRVEKRHAEQWIYMSQGFGVDRAELFSAPILPEVEALTHWLWSINGRGHLVEGVAATNYAIEGATQGIATIMVKGFEQYHGKEGVNLDRKAYWWMEAHASYDDLHPREALEVIKHHATTRDLQHKARHAAQRSLEYLFRALEACYSAYAA